MKNTTQTISINLNTTVWLRNTIHCNWNVVIIKKFLSVSFWQLRELPMTNIPKEWLHISFNVGTTYFHFTVKLWGWLAWAFGENWLWYKRMARHCYHDDVIKWKHFVRYWPLVRGIHRWQWIPLTKASDAELWCFLWSAHEQAVE